MNFSKILCFSALILSGCSSSGLRGFGSSSASGDLRSSVTEPENAHWWAPVDPQSAPAWEILPQAAQPGEVILSKRNELGILSNFAATPFEFRGKRYASVEGFWQMMKFPEARIQGKPDPRLKNKKTKWKFTRDQVSDMVAFEAKRAGDNGSENMKALGIDWVSFEGQRFPYRSAKPGRHHELIEQAMWAKLRQNPQVKEILLKTGDLILKPDHSQNENDPPEWRYFEIWMKIRAEIRREENPAS